MKKEFKEIDLLEDKDIDKVKEITKKINKVFYRNIIISFSIILLLGLFTALLYNSASPLSVVTKEFYLLIILFSLFFFIGITIKFILTKEENIENLKIKKSIYSLIDLLGFIVNGVIISTFILLFIVTTAKVSGNSMNNTYQDNDTILVWNLLYTPKKDDVVVIDSSILIYNTDFIIKRIVATSEDTVYHRNGQFYVNDEFIDYASDVDVNKMLKDFSTGVQYTQVPEDYFIVLGDNRDNSQDSRTMGLVHKDEIVGKSVFRLLPFSNIGLPKKDTD
ncbi:MAG: signal peptidase I [bacterium]